MGAWWPPVAVRNPAATVINNATISLIAAGSNVVLPARRRKGLSGNRSPQSGGGRRRWLENLLVTVNRISKLASGCSNISIGLLVVTGGEAVVDAARH